MSFLAGFESMKTLFSARTKLMFMKFIFICSIQRPWKVGARSWLDVGSSL
jgi:hypothetical protein